MAAVKPVKKPAPSPLGVPVVDKPKSVKPKQTQTKKTNPFTPKMKANC